MVIYEKEYNLAFILMSRYALWWSLIRGCEKVEKIAAERRADVKEALLDWFGVGVKAQEISSFVKRMDLLAQRVSQYLSLRKRLIDDLAWLVMSAEPLKPKSSQASLISKL